MPYFTHGDVRNKLILLHALDRLKKPFSKAHLYRIVYETGCMTFFEFESILQDLENDGLIVSVPKPYGECFAPTQLGRESKEMFDLTIPLSQREKVDAYIDSHMDEFVQERTTFSSLQKAKNGGYSVQLSILERDEIFFGITLMVAAEEDAMKIRSNWEAASADLYSDIWDRLWAGKVAKKTDPETKEQ